MIAILHKITIEFMAKGQTRKILKEWRIWSDPSLIKRKALKSKVKEFSWNLAGGADCHLPNLWDNIWVRMKNLKCLGDTDCKTKSQPKNMVLGEKKEKKNGLRAPINIANEFKNKRGISMYTCVESDWAILSQLKFPTHEPQPIWDGKSTLMAVGLTLQHWKGLEIGIKIVR